ncbi:MAG: biotin-requiring enzyme [SAR86 cluster bacterium BACL1 MAG-120828-bin5]|jgi:multidrug efflux pump subunit AcrA (membrane-fusion protein)|nr:MAG: biotin-requiring enzyme [SAR86 cluster bacterium BACL1 MAG-120828-bin5]KRP01134.1 MAG: biotin-requiring enzyme [SAR86 cluster bacterium BACL1 MAG-120924-bin88]KRP10016.1 MAG: biotin-requiring enzyme [SAR86 cluster bacterium BACL1 MAG-121004-bin11]KRP15428.1 MAG: biotin-requiring enzyme [SAR86 cluster bacterium BACL1 MAG-121001-bin56]KRP20814.1 MAG: biotin-requiring enzyme [SAR86 cluster bacterium BACL1 MAG-121022-bin58]KRP23383.1 MAG: biotin-requiring enzyme [SAR86 cluster bacterium BA
MSKNLRISLYILVPIIIWMISGQFIAEDTKDEKKLKVVPSVVISISEAALMAPTITLNAAAISEKRVRVMAKTSGEVMPNNVTQGQWVAKDQVLCRLGVVELNRTEVKAPFSGFIEKIVKPGNLLNRGETCAVIIELDPITFIAEVPEAEIQQVIKGQKVLIELVTGESISSNLSFVSKSATPSTRSFRVEAQIKNSSGLIRDGITGTMHIITNEILAHKISPSILLLSDDGIIGIRAVDDDNAVQFIPVKIIEDTQDGVWVTGIPNLTKIIVLGQGFVENGQNVQVTELTTI